MEWNEVHIVTNNWICYTHELEQRIQSYDMMKYAKNYGKMGQKSTPRFLRTGSGARFLRFAEISPEQWLRWLGLAGVPHLARDGDGPDPPVRPTKWRPPSRISSSRTAPSHWLLGGGIISTKSPDLHIFMTYSLYHNFASVAPFWACSISNCSSRCALHFIPLHHVHLSSSWCPKCCCKSAM